LVDGSFYAKEATDEKLPERLIVGGSGRRGQNGRTTRTTLPQVDGSGNATSLGGTVGDLTIRGLMTAWDGHGWVFLSVKKERAGLWDRVGILK
jgi:hypothetical protein